MAWHLAPTLDVLRTEINKAWTMRDKTSDGTIGDPAHSARTSDHNPDERGVVCAIDIDEDLTTPAAPPPSFHEGQAAKKLLVDRVLELARAGKLPQLHYIVYERQVYSATKKGPDGKFWTPNPYTGANAHEHHVHFSVFHEPALADRTDPWNIKEPPVPTPSVPPRPPYDPAKQNPWLWDGLKTDTPGDFNTPETKLNTILKQQAEILRLLREK